MTLSEYVQTIASLTFLAVRQGVLPTQSAVVGVLAAVLANVSGAKFRELAAAFDTIADADGEPPREVASTDPPRVEWNRAPKPEVRP